MLVPFAVIAGLLCTESGIAKPLPQQEQPPEAVGMFYSDLSPYGEWIEFEPGLYAWHPLNVSPAWRPYSEGRWVWSDYGWFWVTAEPFGWATYHYGRWYLDASYGWIWFPDSIWGPAWVEWRCNNDYIGWAPLPPYARFHVTVGIRFTTRWAAPPVYWSFVAFNRFVSNRTYRAYAPESSVRHLISATRSTGRYDIDQNRIVNRGVDREFIQKRIPTRIESADVTIIDQRGVERLTREGQRDRIEIYRPHRNESGRADVRIEARRAEVKPSFDINRVDQYRGIPGRERTPSDITRQTGRSFEMPSRQFDQQDRTGQRPDRPEVNRERPPRYQQQFPTPRVKRDSPIRTPDRRDSGKSPGKSRHGF
jgi:hypothetical protein